MLFSAANMFSKMVNKAAFKRGKHYTDHALKLVITVSNDEQSTISLFSGVADCFMENEICRMY